MSAVQKPSTIAFIGSAGVPNRYGGFESFVEHCAPEVVASGRRVLVTCDAHLYPERTARLRGMELRYINVRANGGLSPVHDMLAFLCVWREADAVVVLGVSAGPFFLVMRMLAALRGQRLVVNIDGVEWRRAKFSRRKRLLLRMFDLLGQTSAHAIIYDNPALLPFVHAAFRHKAHYIAYSGDHVQRMPDEAPEPGTALTICRIEPENNLELLIQGAVASSLNRYTIVGNWNASAYGRTLRADWAGNSRLALLDPDYDPLRVARLRERCQIYLHGHSVGGTNPSLVEMLFYDAELFCFDCSFNRETAGDRAVYFSDAAGLSAQLDRAVHLPRRQHPPPAHFSAKRIAERYIAVADPSSVAT